MFRIQKLVSSTISTVTLAAIGLVLGTVGAAAITVNCDKGGSVAKALNGGAKVIKVFGDCEENVEITEDGIVLDGQGVATLTGDGATPAITVSARNVVIRDWAEIRGGNSRGILVTDASKVEIRNIGFINAFTGIFVNRVSFAIIKNVFISDPLEEIPAEINGGLAHGLLVTRGSYARLIDSDIVDNAARGIVVVGNSTVDLVGTNNISENRNRGVFVAHSYVDFSGTNTVQDNAGTSPFDSGADILCSAYSRITVSVPIMSTSQKDLRVFNKCDVREPDGMWAP